MMGLFLKEAIIKTSSLHADLYRGGDHVFLAELALLGKLVQVPAILFNRGLSRNYQISEEKFNAKLIRDCVPEKIHDGITFPFCRLIYAHLEMINRLDSPQGDKDMMMKDVLQCYRARFGAQMQFEITRAIDSINRGHFFDSWDNTTAISNSKALEFLTSFNINSLIRRFLEAQNIFPELTEINDAIMKCTGFMADIMKAGATGDKSFAHTGEANRRGGLAI
jgi:hypothetical protein